MNDPGLRAAGRAEVTNEDLLELSCDVLALAALEDQITAENAPPAGADHCGGRERPDLARGGRDPGRARDSAASRHPHQRWGCDGLYFEWVQDIGRLFWTREEIRAKLAEKLSDAFDRVWALGQDRGYRSGRRRSSPASAMSRRRSRREASSRDGPTPGGRTSPHRSCAGRDVPGAGRPWRRARGVGGRASASAARRCALSTSRKTSGSSAG